mgnify:CR=1 FL=1
MDLIIKKVSKEEIDRVMVIINDAKKLLSKDSLQWQQGYPNKEVMLLDISNNHLYGAYDNGVLIAVVALVDGVNINYTEIYEGSWIDPVSEKDLVIHRIAVKEEYHGKKIGKLLMDFAEEYAKENGFISIKVDTHTKNKAMQKLCTNNDYSYRGIIYLKRDEVDNSRIAFEKVVKK